MAAAWVRAYERVRELVSNGRTVPTQPSFNSLTRSCAGTTTGQAFRRRGGRWLMGPGDGVEVVEQGGDAA